MVMQRGSVISNTIFALIKTPLLGDFLRIVARFKNDRANELVSSIVGVVENDIPELWEFTVSVEETPALYQVILNQQLLVADILYGKQMTNDVSFNSRMKTLPLFLRRGDGNVLLPEGNRIIKEGDRYLMCGSTEAREYMLHCLKNINLLESVLTGEDKPNGWILRKLWERRHGKDSKIIKDTNLVDQQEEQTSAVLSEEEIKKDDSG